MNKFHIDFIMRVCDIYLYILYINLFINFLKKKDKIILKTNKNRIII